MSSVDTEHRRLCNTLLDALETGDVEAVDRCYAPDMVLWFNVAGQEIGREENLAAIEQGKTMHRRRTYNDRQISTFADGFVAQYTVSVVLHDGTRRALSACLVAQVRDGLIVRLDDYIDSGKFMPRKRRSGGEANGKAGEAQRAGAEEVPA